MENKNTKPGKPKQSKVALTFKIIGSTVFIGAFIFCATWTVKNWSKVSDSLTNGTNLSTEEDLKTSWTDGFNSALPYKEKLEQELNDIKESYIQLKEEKAESDKTYQDLINANQKTYEENLAKLEADLATSASNIQTLTNQLNSEIADNEVLTAKITELNNKITKLSQENSDKTILINELQSEIAELKEQLNNNFIDNNEISATILAYQEQIAELQASLKVYEDYYNQAQENQVIATYKIGDEVYSIQTITKGNTAQKVEDPESTEYFIFHGWLLNGETVDPSTLILTENTVFTADATYKYDANFYDESTLVDSQIIVQDATATAPTIENTDGKIFEGWSLDGSTLIDVSSTPITENTNFYAVFTYKYTVTFVDQGETISDPQLIEYGTFASLDNISETGKAHHVFMGWSIDGENVVDVTSYNITTDTQFIAVYKESKLITQKISFNISEFTFTANGKDNPVTVNNPTTTTGSKLYTSSGDFEDSSVLNSISSYNIQQIEFNEINLSIGYKTNSSFADYKYYSCITSTTCVLNTDNSFTAQIKYEGTNDSGSTDSMNANYSFTFEINFDTEDKCLTIKLIEFDFIAYSASNPDYSFPSGLKDIWLSFGTNNTITYYSSTEIAK